MTEKRTLLRQTRRPVTQYSPLSDKYMKFNAKTLYAQAHSAFEVANGRTVIPIQEFILVEPRTSDTVTIKANGNWGQVTLICECLEAPKIAVCIHAKTFAPILKTLDGEVVIAKAAGKLAAGVTCGSFYCEVPIEKAAQFPNMSIPPSGGSVFKASKFIDFCSIVDDICDQNSLKNFIANGMIGPSGAFASDGHMFVAVEDLRVDTPCWIPNGLSSKLQAHISQDETVTLCSSESDLFVVSKNAVFKRLRPSQDPDVYKQLWPSIWSVIAAEETGKVDAPADLQMRLSRINGYYMVNIYESKGRAIMSGWNPQGMGYRYSDDIGACDEGISVLLSISLFKKMLSMCNKESAISVSGKRSIRVSDGTKTVALVAAV